MNKYDIEVRLRYHKDLIGSHISLTQRILMKLKPEQLDITHYNIKKDKFMSEEDCIISIREENDKIFLSIQSIYENDKLKARKQGEQLIEKYVKLLTYNVHQQNRDSYKFPIKFTYNIRDIAVIEKTYNKYNKFMLELNKSKTKYQQKRSYRFKGFYYGSN